MAARIANHMTQKELACASGVSRATIAQIESGESDPCLSSIAALARALRTSPMMLLLEPGVLSYDVVEKLQKRIETVNVPQEIIEKINAFIDASSRRVRQGIIKEVIRSLGVGGGAAVGAAIGSVLLPGTGASAGAALGGLLEEHSAAQLRIHQKPALQQRTLRKGPKPRRGES